MSLSEDLPWIGSFRKRRLLLRLRIRLEASAHVKTHLCGLQLLKIQEQSHGCVPGPSWQRMRIAGVFLHWHAASAQPQASLSCVLQGDGVVRKIQGKKHILMS